VGKTINGDIPALWYRLRLRMQFIHSYFILLFVFVCVRCLRGAEVANRVERRVRAGHGRARVATGFFVVSGLFISFFQHNG